MLVELEGGTKVAGLKDGQPRRDGDLLIWDHFASTLSLRVLELHGRATLRNDDRDEVLFILGEERSIYVPAGTPCELAGDVTIISALAPRADNRQPTTGNRQTTADRWY